MIFSVLCHSRVGGNDIEHVFRAKQQRHFANDISKFIIKSSKPYFFLISSNEITSSPFLYETK
ncbi:hypothetical protein APHACPA_1295 [Rickettsia amblyommatis str. Ac/Pa]|uniref:Uncharacterized protein n=1 Tax=Rickettsia amblyommatis str. Ac/Pa TaxID=1359164 RepID=A0A0F3N5U6_RICAM|nr:hypothetical protein APHACPA_1295 [Rickettsia amblyommatis str. Ac/Pa]